VEQSMGAQLITQLPKEVTFLPEVYLAAGFARSHSRENPSGQAPSDLLVVEPQWF